MPKYARTEEVDAEQVVIPDTDKESAKKGIPTASGGGFVRYELGKDEHGEDKHFFSVAVHKVGRQAQEGDWIVTDKRGQTSIMTDEAFKKEYKAVAEKDQPKEVVAQPTTSGADRAAARQQMATV